LPAAIVAGVVACCVAAGDSKVRGSDAVLLVAVLTQRGRRTGRRHQTVLEVLRYDPTDSAIVCPAWGTGTNSFQNIDRNPEVIITVGRRERPARAERLAVPDAAQELLDHAQRHPTMFGLLTRWLVGRGVEVTPVACSELARSCPVVAFRPGDASGRHEPSPSDRSRRSTRRSPRSGGS
jgi:deazaflavin-dependent oxidoreductase (nitroreductase family)